VPGGLGFSNVFVLLVHTRAYGRVSKGRAYGLAGYAAGGGDGPFWIDLLHARPYCGATL